YVGSGFFGKSKGSSTVYDVPSGRSLGLNGHLDRPSSDSVDGKRYQHTAARLDCNLRFPRYGRMDTRLRAKRPVEAPRASEGHRHRGRRPDGFDQRLRFLPGSDFGLRSYALKHIRCGGGLYAALPQDQGHGFRPEQIVGIFKKLVELFFV